MNKRLKQIRNTLSPKVSQEKFGELLGVSRDSMATYENGRVVPSDTFIQLLCTKFNINEYWLRTGDGAMYAENKTTILSQATTLLNLDGTEQKFLAAYLNLSPEARKNLKDACRQIVEFYKAQDEVSATIAVRPAANDTKLTVEQKKHIVMNELPDEEKGQTSSVSTGGNGLGENLA